MLSPVQNSASTSRSCRHGALRNRKAVCDRSSFHGEWQEVVSLVARSMMRNTGRQNASNEFSSHSTYDGERYRDCHTIAFKPKTKMARK
jgi:hypothetical protein